MTEQNQGVPGGQEVSGEAFGIYAPVQNQDGTDPLFDDAPATPATTEGQQGQPSTPASGAPTTEPGQPAPQPQTPPEQAQAGEGDQPGGQQEQQNLIEGRWKSTEDVVAAYKNLQRFEGRTRQELTQVQARAQQAEERSAQLEQALMQVAQRLQAMEMAESGYRGDVPQQPAFDPAQYQRQVQQQMQNQLQRQQQDQLVAQAQAEVASFRANHRELVPGSEVDQLMSFIVEDFQTVEDGQGNNSLDYNLFPMHQQNLELAYELAQSPTLWNLFNELDLQPTQESLQIAKEAAANPALAEILLAQPHLVDSDHGMNVARKQAQLPTMVAATAAQGAAPTPQQQQSAAYLETPGKGAPAGGAPGQRPRDEVDEAILAYRQDGQRSVFGV